VVTPIKQKTINKPADPQKAAPSIGLDQFKAEIEKRAKELYLTRQSIKAPGDALSDWLMAEEEIKAKHKIA
jgi:Protein of unknown function (DUF2934)